MEQKMVKLVFTISKKAYDACKLGNATFSSGGVRTATGQLMELAKPAVKSVVKSAGKTALNSAVSNVCSPISMVSSIANNVQSGFIQKSVNKANRKLDISLQKLDEIQGVVNSLTKSNALNWVNCAFGMVNCGISIAGFCLTLNKLNDVSKQIESLNQTINNAIISRNIEDFQRYCGYIKTDIDIIRKTYIISSDMAITISHAIGDISAFLNRIYSQMMNNELDFMLASKILFTLGIAYGQLIRIYTSKYYYQVGEIPPNYENWKDILENKIMDDDFFENYQRKLTIKALDIPIIDRLNLVKCAKYSIANQIGTMEYERQLIEKIGKDTYYNLDEIVERKIKDDNIAIDNDRVYIDLY